MLSSKNWMFLLAFAGMLFLPWSEIQAQSNYSNQNIQRANQLRRAPTQQRMQRPQQPTSRRVNQGYVPKHAQGIQTGVISPASQYFEEQNGSIQTVSGEMRGMQRGTRVAQAYSETPIYDDGIVGEEVIGGSVMQGGVMSGGMVSGCADCGGNGMSTHGYSNGCSSCGGGCSPGFGGPVETAVGAGYFSAGCAGDCGGSCGGGCVGRGACPPSAMDECWVNGLAGIFSAGEYFIGGTGFRSNQFQVPNSTTIFDDASFGFYGGFNFGLPLCRLTCGVLTGQVGVRSVSSEFDGNSFFSDNRDQTFFTAGLFRRVDYGLQVGVVADVLREEWFTETETVQIRGDLGWVYPSGTILGFRFNSSVQDDVSDGIINGNRFTGLTTDILETYRFYYRQPGQWGGHSEVSLGWSDDNHFVIGLDHDIPVSETWAMQSSLTYLAGEDLPPTSPFAGNGNEAWNLSVGFAWRPRGRSWYRSYDRPMFGVADNGSMIITRN